MKGKEAQTEIRNVPVSPLLRRTARGSGPLCPQHSPFDSPRFPDRGTISAGISVNDTWISVAAAETGRLS